MTVAELKELLREHGLPVSGKKADLISRLSQTVEDTNEDSEEVKEEKEDIPVDEDSFEEEEDDYYDGQ